MKNKIMVIVLVCSVIVLSVCLHIQKFWHFSPKCTTVMTVPQLHNGDAKFYKDKVITSLHGSLRMYDLKGNEIAKYEDVHSNWICCLEDENLILYGNANKEIGIVQLDDYNQLISNRIILKCEHLHIDPCILKVNHTYYFTATEIKGKVNNSDPNLENGLYTVRLFSSTNLKDWKFISNIVQAKNNIEDIDLFYKNNWFYAIYEKEQYDKGNSAVEMIKSLNSTGSKWGKAIEVLPSDCDHELARIEVLSNNQYRIYYSCDKEELGESYMEVRFIGHNTIRIFK